MCSLTYKHLLTTCIVVLCFAITMLCIHGTPKLYNSIAKDNCTDYKIEIEMLQNAINNITLYFFQRETVLNNSRCHY